MSDPLKKIVVVDPSTEVDSVTIQLSPGGSEGWIVLPGNVHVRMSLTSEDPRRLFQRFMVFLSAALSNPDLIRKACEQIEKQRASEV